MFKELVIEREEFFIAFQIVRQRLFVSIYSPTVKILNICLDLGTSHIDWL